MVERGLEKQALQRSSAVDGNDLDDEADGNVDLTGKCHAFLRSLTVYNQTKLL